jgi:DNA primase
MNCEQANKISIREVLNGFSLFPSKEKSNKAFYYAIDRKERSPSLHVDFKRNTAYDYGTAKSYDVVAIVQTIKQCNVSEALEYLKSNSYPKAFENGTAFKKEKETVKSYEIQEVKLVTHPALLRYLKSRRIINASEYLKEIHYCNAGRYYFGIAFQNDSEGYEVRNKYRGICLGRKNITTIKNDCDQVSVFEGFFDFLSFLSISDSLESDPSDYLILNSVAMVNRIENLIKDYTKVELFMDNDKAGNVATKKIKLQHPNVSDNRLLYPNHKDLNDFIMDRK